jgi:hypothetical protein
MSDEPRPWDKLPAEPALWWERFDKYYRSLGAEASLLGAYKAWSKAQGKGNPRASSTPTSWREAAATWSWESRTAAWVAYQAEERRQLEAEAMTKSREQRIAILNATFSKALEALRSVQVANAKLGEVTNAIRMVVQELRREYEQGEGNTAVGEQSKMPSIDSLPDVDEETIERMVANLLTAETVKKKASQ